MIYAEGTNIKYWTPNISAQTEYVHYGSSPSPQWKSSASSKQIGHGPLFIAYLAYYITLDSCCFVF